MMYAPRMTGVSSYAAQAELCVAWLTLKPDGSCSSPMTTTELALRPAVVLGTFAHDSANGAALSAAVRCAAVVAVAVADAASATTAAPTRASAQKRLCIDSLRVVCAGSRWTAAPALSHARWGRPAHEPMTTAR